MKYLILMLFALNSYADIKMDFVLLTKTSSVEFKDAQKAREWLDNNKDNKSWGHRDHWKKRGESETCPGTERTVGVAPDEYQECFYPANYTVCGKNPDLLDIASDCQDITLEVQAKELLVEIKKDMTYGKDLYAKIRLMTSGKGLSIGQRKTLRSNLSSIRDDLFDGDICSAREDIAAITPDAVISSSDIANVLAEIDSHKTCL